jgi:hypothetical protein
MYSSGIIGMHIWALQRKKKKKNECDETSGKQKFKEVLAVYFRSA